MNGNADTCRALDGRCGRPVRGDGYCKMHRQRSIEGGDVDAPIRPRRSAAEVALRINGLKYCTKCTNWLPESNFTGSRHNSDGLRADCKRCINLKQRAVRYNVSVEALERILESQSGACAICACALGDSFHVDHDHSCCPPAVSCGNCIRGLLCSKCNTLLGLADDDYERLISAAAYLGIQQSSRFTIQWSDGGDVHVLSALANNPEGEWK